MHPKLTQIITGRGFNGTVNVNVSSLSNVLVQSFDVPTTIDEFTDTKGAQKTLQISNVTFTDGTTLSWPDHPIEDIMAALFAVSSSSPSEISISSSNASMTLLGNSHEPAIIGVRARCQGPGAIVEKRMRVSGNLEMERDGDVDIGKRHGVPIPDFTEPVEVRIKATESKLQVFDITIHFNPPVVKVTSCTTMTTMLFTCTINNVDGYVQMVGLAMFQKELQGIISVAKIVLMRMSSGVPHLSGVSANVSIVAGDIPIAGGGNGAAAILRRMAYPFTRELWQVAMAEPNRKLLYNAITSTSDNDGNGVFGDCNGDGKFDMGDVLFAQGYYYYVPGISNLTNWQMKQLRPMGGVGMRDVVYLMNTYADKMKFIVSTDFRVGTDYLYLGVKLLDRSGDIPVPLTTRVLFAIHTTQSGLKFAGTTGYYDANKQLLLVYGTMHEDGWYVITTHDIEPTGPVYPSSIDPDSGDIENRMIPDNETDVGIAFSIETIPHGEILLTR